LRTAIASCAVLGETPAQAAASSRVFPRGGNVDPVLLELDDKRRLLRGRELAAEERGPKHVVELVCHRDDAHR